MTTIILVVINLLALIAFAFVLRALGKIVIPLWAEKDFIFSSPKLGRIKARRRSGRIIGFFDNLVGKGKHVDETGKTVDNEVTPSGFWWKHFGVRFIGLDDVYTYKIARGATENLENGELVYDEDTASSIYYEGTYPITVFLYTMEGLLFRVKLQLKTATVDAAKALSLPVSWTIPLFAAVIGASRDHFGSHKAKDLITAQNEGVGVKVSLKKTANSGYVKLIRSLNSTRHGNISLAEVCGQRIDAVNVVDIDFATAQDKETYFKPYVADQDKKAKIREAEGKAKALTIDGKAQKDAAADKGEAARLEGQGVADAYKAQRDAINGDKATANVLVAEKLSKMPSLKAIGATPFITVD